MTTKNNIILSKELLHVSDFESQLVENCTISLDRWLLEDKQLLENLQISLRLEVTDQIERIANDLQSIPLIAVDFRNADDCRVCTQVRILRSVWRYTGEIFAFNANRNRIQLMLRCGVDSFDLDYQYGEFGVQNYADTLTFYETAM
ncbi:MAG: DUF934 domain-containing protein [Candidatus Thioglobus sp.]|nr:DUF934 domain-containing protein [Candidatus Thioglobus sp.]MBT7128041.1 DUF934 domain-containing protein [Candidatus Thioglobus sp.]